MDIDSSQTFNFLPVPTDIHFGYGIVETMPARINGVGGSRPFVVTDPGIRAAGILDRILGILDRAGLTPAVFDSVKPDSGSNLIDEAAGQLRTSGCDVVIGVGGGSSLDTAKAVAMLGTNPGSALDYTGLHRVPTRPMPTIAIPTTAGTGSEVTLWSVFTDETRDLKVAIGSIYLYPSVALCDPELTLSLPPPMTAATGMDALAHAIECYTNNACQPISAALALRAIEIIGAHLRSAVLNGRERKSRYAMLLASTMAGIAMNPTRLGLAHALAMPLGSWDLRVPHGIAVAATLPFVMQFNHVAEPGRFADVARALGEPVDRLPRLRAAARAVSAVQALARDVGMVDGLGPHGVEPSHFDRIAEEAMKSGNVPVNPRLASVEDLRHILRQSL